MAPPQSTTKMPESSAREGNTSSTPNKDPEAARNLHFFKIILQSSIDDKKMIIPPKFAMNFGDSLGDVAELTLPNCCTWLVGIKKESRSICFDNHWHEFLELHSIRQGYLLVFTYKGISRFDVHIFDHSYSEIHEHCESVASFMPVIKEEVDLSTQYDLKQEKLRKHGKKNSMVVSKLREKGKKNSVVSNPGIAKVSLETNAAIQAANMLKRQNPSFMVVLKQSNIPKYLYITTEFAASYLRGVSDFLRIEIPQGRGWHCKVSRRPNDSLMLTSGWAAFVRDNDLQIGDVCVFELSERKNAALEVSMFRFRASVPNPGRNKQCKNSVSPVEMLKLKKEMEEADIGMSGKCEFLKAESSVFGET